MPGGDRTGPMGQGPMTGRAAGYCTGSPTLGSMNPAPGRGAVGAASGEAADAVVAVVVAVAVAADGVLVHPLPMEPPLVHR